MAGTEWLKNYPPESVVRRAYDLAALAHEGATRENGAPYITHPLAVAETVRGWGLDEASIAAALLHDVVEDTAITLADLKKDFGDEIAFLVNGLTKLKDLKYQKEGDAENMRRFIIAFSEDLRVLIIKLADRLHNMQTLQFLPKERQVPIALETTEIYAPLAYRLGMQKLSGELEDLAFPYIYPEEYQWLIKEVKETYEDRQEYINRILPVVKQALADHDIHPLAIDARAKRYYSLYKKLLRHNMNLNEIYDLVALRIIVATVEECYAALGVIHSLWQPLPGRFKDYIARPKTNGYRSLHTTVFCLEGKILEIQIKTKEMHEENELGIAAHWAYEQVKKSSQKLAGWSGVKNKKELVWVQQLQNWQKAFATHKEFLEAVKVDFFKDRIFVFTPGNDVVDLPAGATPVDFAYRIHTQIGNTCVGAKINGKIVPLTTELHSGDIVEIITQKGKKPSKDWLQFTKTEMAKKHIRSALKENTRALQKRAGPIGTEFKIVNVDRPGYLKEVTSIFAKNKVNITFLHSQTDARQVFSTVLLRTSPLPPAKAEKIVVSLKKIPSTKEVNFRILF
jgi:GTP pyrophosphokinase